jgi:peptide/nickel transport system substrate-binding protein
MRATAHTLRLLALIAVLALFAAACGGADSGTGGDVSADGSDEPADDGAATDEATDGTGEATDEPADEPSDAADGGEGGGEGDVLVFGTTEQPSTIDPADVYEKLASDILFNTTNRLVEFDPETGEIGPGLAEEYEVSEDGLTYTFTLREGVTFHDGSEMTSEDVVWSINRSLNIAHPDGASFLLSSIESIEAPDDTTVVITVSEANSTFLARLNYTVASVLPSDSDVYRAPDAPLEAADDSEAAAETLLEEAESFLTQDAIVGTGPYQMTDYQPGETMTLERFEDFWGEAPAIQTVRIQFFADTTQMRNAIAAGEIDLAINDLDPTEVASLEGEDVEVIAESGGRTSYIVFDVTQPPFDNPEVRRAIAANIDRQRIVDEAFEGQAQPLFSMIPDTFAESVDHMSDVQFDEAALGETPIEFELWYPADRYTNQEQVAEIVSRSLNESGLFNVTTNTAEWATEYSTHLNDGAYGAYLLGWYPDYLDPDDYIEPFYETGGFIGFYSSEEMDQLILEEQQAEVGSEERAEIFDQIQQLAAEDMPYVPLYSEGQEAYFNPRVQGVETTLGPAQQTWFYVLSLS